MTVGHPWLGPQFVKLSQGRMTLTAIIVALNFYKTLIFFCISNLFGSDMFLAYSIHKVVCFSFLPTQQSVKVLLIAPGYGRFLYTDINISTLQLFIHNSA